MLAALKQHVGHQLMCGPSDAGLDVCVHFRGAHNEQAVVQAGAARGIDLRALSYYTIPNAVAQCAVRPGLLLGFAAVTPPRIEAGVRVLAEAMNACK